MKKIIFFIIASSVVIQAVAKDKIEKSAQPMEIARLIAEKLIRDTPFAYGLDLAVDNKVFNGVQMIDFGRNFQVSGKTTAYAYTCFEAPRDMDMDIQVAHNDACTIWFNGKIVYRKEGNEKLAFVYDERSLNFPDQFHVRFKKGNNPMLIKSETNKNEWQVYLQPPSKKGAVSMGSEIYPEIGLERMKLVDKKVADISNWLILGPFAEDKEIDRTLMLEDSPVFGEMFQGESGLITWTIPKVDVVGNFIDPRPWGTNYTWNYHNGGLAWAMKKLGELLDEPEFEKYADDFCNFQLRSIPFVKYEMQTLGRTNVPNSSLINTPLLDFTLAPSLPFIYRLRKDSAFINRDEYRQFTAGMFHYARYEQLRLPGFSNYTRNTPEKYTTWVDDMFMGIPFLIQAALYSDNRLDREYFFDDAVNQLLDFNKQVWDSKANLYVHAKYSDENVAMVHWSRANGWGIWATTEVLLHLPKNHPKYGTILKEYQKHVESLVRLQDEDGFWHNILDHPESRPEVSGTAIFTMALARGINNGWISKKKYRQVVQKGWNAVSSQVDQNGTVHNICCGTMCSPDIKYYMNQPFFDNDTHGLFAILFAAMEIYKMGAKSR
jgi:rhamnogalacturonyl hydrolase YesR